MKRFICLFVCFFSCTKALAWAPATHLFYAKEIFSFLNLLPPSISQLIQEFRLDFLYGCIAADITIGKAYVEYLYNCHNFDVGLGLLSHAKTPSERAFVYGYLSHLAADTVSHNYFVPYQNISQLEGRAKFVHAFWEVSVDQYFSEVAWGDMGDIIKNPRKFGETSIFTSQIGSGCYLVQGNINTVQFPQDTSVVVTRTISGTTYQKRYRVVNSTSTAALLQSLDGDVPQINDSFQNPTGYVFSISSVAAPTVDKYSGQLMFIDNKAGFTPSTDETVTLRTVIKF